MKSEFSKKPIREFGRVVTGKTPPKKVETAFGDSYPFITPRDLDGSKFVIKTERYLSEDGLASVKNNVIPPDSVLVSCIGSDMGKVALSTQKSLTNQQLNTIIVDTSKHNPEYVYYALSLEKNSLMRAAGGTTMPILNKTSFENYEIYAPDKKIQDRIVEVIKPIDEKIAHNITINQTLEKIAQRIFKSWFIDFDPVKANAEGVPFNGLSPEIQALFPSEFEDSALGMIPKGWQVKPFSSIAMLQTKSAKPALEPEKEWVHYSIPAYDDAQFPTLDLGEKIKSNKYKMFENTILVSKLNPRFKRIWFPYIDSNDISSICSTEFMQFIPTHEDWYAYTLSYVISNRFQSEMLKTVSGTTGSRQRAQPNEVSVMSALIPHTEIIKAFSGVVLPLIRRHQDNLVQINTLKNLQNRLLPKLISGKISLSEANQELKETV